MRGNVRAFRGAIEAIESPSASLERELEKTRSSHTNNTSTSKALKLFNRPKLDSELKKESSSRYRKLEKTIEKLNKESSDPSIENDFE